MEFGIDSRVNFGKSFEHESEDLPRPVKASTHVEERLSFIEDKDMAIAGGNSGSLHSTEGEENQLWVDTEDILTWELDVHDVDMDTCFSLPNLELNIRGSADFATSFGTVEGEVFSHEGGSNPNSYDRDPVTRYDSILNCNILDEYILDEYILDDNSLEGDKNILDNNSLGENVLEDDNNILDDNILDDNILSDNTLAVEHVLGGDNNTLDNNSLGKNALEDDNRTLNFVSLENSILDNSIRDKILNDNILEDNTFTWSQEDISRTNDDGATHCTQDEGAKKASQLVADRLTEAQQAQLTKAQQAQRLAKAQHTERLAQAQQARFARLLMTIQEDRIPGRVGEPRDTQKFPGKAAPDFLIPDILNVDTPASVLPTMKPFPQHLELKENWSRYHLDDWVNINCSSLTLPSILKEFSEGHSVGPVELRLCLTSNSLSWNDPVVLGDVQCAIDNGLDMGRLAAIASIRWAKRACRMCKYREAVGNTVWKFPCISRRCEGLTTWKCRCLHGSEVDSNMKLEEGLYHPSIVDGTIKDATLVPPRRLWDVRFNRVLLFYGDVIQLCSWCLENVSPP